MLQTEQAEANTAMQRLWVGVGSIAGFVAVLTAAIGAHAVAPDARPLVASAAQMLGWHALALLGVAFWSPHGGRLAEAAGVAFTLGMVLFALGVDVHAFTAISLGIVAPTGGTLLMLGWLLLAGSAARSPLRRR
jgi:uncharacterized membrane protein YgdD (TMEM256/DUF423 family)